MGIEGELKTYLQVIWRYKWMIAACAMIASIVALGISLRLTPLYKATATLRVASAPGGASDYTYIGSQTRLSNTYVEIASSDVSLNEVAKRLGLQKRPTVEVAVVAETELIKISSSNPNPVLARDVANTLANLMVEQSMQLYGGNAPTAREILEGQLKQAKDDLDNAVADYDKALRADSATATPPASSTQISSPNLDMLERFVGIKQQIYSNLLQEYQTARTTEQINSLEQQLKQAKGELDSSIADYYNALHDYKPTETLPAQGTPLPNPDLDMLANFVKVRQQIYGDILLNYENMRTSEQLRTNAITIAELADLPLKPSTPKIPLNAALGLIAGLVMGVILAFLFEGMDDTLQDEEDVRAMTVLPIIGLIPKSKQKTLAPSQNGRLEPMPAFRHLGMRLLLSEPMAKSTSLLITSPEPGAGKSTVAANLSISLAEAGHRVVLLDMDFHRPRLHSIFKLPNEKGLSDFLCGKIQLDPTLLHTLSPNLRVATAGLSLDGTYEWLAPNKIKALLGLLKKHADYVLIDAPAFLSCADPSLIASQADALILVVARRGTERDKFRLTLLQLTELNTKIAGIVLNKAANSRLYSYYQQQVSKKGKPLKKEMPIPPEEAQPPIEM